jgi:hypothetical protein
MSRNDLVESSVDARTVALESLRMEALGQTRLAVIAAAFANACLFQSAFTPHFLLGPLFVLCVALAVACVLRTAVSLASAWRIRAGRASLTEIHARVLLERERQAQDEEHAWLKARVIEIALVYGLFQFAAAAVGLLASSAAIIATMFIGGGLLRTHLFRRHEAAEQLRALLRSWDQHAQAAALPMPA